MEKDKKMEFIKNKLINKVFINSLETWGLLLDTDDIVPEKYLEKMQKYIFKEFKRKMKQVNKVYSARLKALNAKQNSVKSEQQQVKTAEPELKFEPK